MTQVGIKAVAKAVPKKILTNSDLEKMVETTDEWITTRTGIKERHLLEPDERIVDYTIAATREACQKANMTGDQLDFIISSTISPDRISPAQSFEVARAIEANNAFCFDVNAACSGFIYALTIGASFLQLGQGKNGLATAGEQLTRVADYSDRNSCVLFGDGAAAAVLTTEHPEHIILATELGSDPTLGEEVTIGGINDLLRDRRSDYYFKQNGKVVFRFAVTKIKEMMDVVPRKVGLTPEDITHVIAHQANLRILDAARENAPGNAEFISVIDRYGNTSSASIGLALADTWDRFKKGDRILLIGFGGGLSWGAALIEW